MPTKSEIKIIIDESGNYTLWVSGDEYRGILESSNSIGEAIIEIGNSLKSRENIKSKGNILNND